ncbi:MAG: CRISPR-associated endoribonuclease Cas2 [Firmicutes bacterium ADurb.Bin193]|nr:MAG: CRISPR-associated endoribonuclease Cas2 [Firmicutes bacterium ADurb.Bin193]
MILLSYDISNDKKRSRFAKYIKKYGHRLQYSVYEIDNSPRILDNVITDIRNKFEKSFDQSDSIYIFKLNPMCETYKFGYAKNEDNDVILIK